MSLPPPPGLQRPPSQTQSQQQPPASLPARPPSTSTPYTTPSTVSRAPSHGPDASRGAAGAGYGFQPRAVAAQSYQAPARTHTPAAAAYPAASTYSAAPTYSAGYQYPQQQQHQQHQHQHQHQHQQTYQAQQTSYYGQPQPQQSYDASTYGSQPAHQTHNAYQPKRANNGSYGNRPAHARYGESSGDPEMDAQIAQWQSAYMSKDGGEAAAAASTTQAPGAGRRDGPSAATGANTGPLGSFQRLHDPTASTTSTPPNGAATTASTTPIPGQNPATAIATTQETTEPTKTVLRSGGGQTWSDTTLLEWDPAHFRLFCGNLAGEVTDDSLLKAFSKYPSVQKARVIRDKRTEKSKGYGFVSFSDGDDYFRAAREMQGKYIGSHPVLLRRAMTEIRPVSASKGKHGKGKGKGKHGHSSGSGSGRESKPSGPASGKVADGGVKKQKTKGGLRVLG
ncbi:uncharacterized protein GIQ15_03734 [Arthroderma uncinatum]|uniref:uncharacterized protein n=1 Tax=Arthroderma uncinatum TaxID=74035 RepID=UPI00144AD2FB|nr:uncharacterized protein GIQ15_03734 [Arthroderma uncinatum]KAF3484410.1 hypothetical protein GIQ15_03734 [Arthroderma uncinatum]